MLAIGIVGALVMVYAKPSGVVQFETSRTDTLEATQGVDTFARFRAGTRLTTFVYICKKTALRGLDRGALLGQQAF